MHGPLHSEAVQGPRVTGTPFQQREVVHANRRFAGGFCLKNQFSFSVFTFLQKAGTYQDRVLQLFTRAIPDSSQTKLVEPFNLTIARASLALTHSLARSGLARFDEQVIPNELRAQNFRFWNPERSAKEAQLSNHTPSLTKPSSVLLLHSEPRLAQPTAEHRPASLEF